MKTTPPPVLSFREKMRERLVERRPIALGDFDALMEWEDEMLAFCNRLAEENDRLRQPRIVQAWRILRSGRGN